MAIKLIAKERNFRSESMKKIIWIFIKIKLGYLIKYHHWLCSKYGLFGNKTIKFRYTKLWVWNKFADESQKHL